MGNDLNNSENYSSMSFIAGESPLSIIEFPFWFLYQKSGLFTSFNMNRIVLAELC